jgi:hypothetical protein
VLADGSFAIALTRRPQPLWKSCGSPVQNVCTRAAAMACRRAAARACGGARTCAPIFVSRFACAPVVNH